MSYISVYQSDLLDEASSGVITSSQAAQLWKQLSDKDANRWKMTWVRLAYAFGAFLIIGSMTWFTSIVWDQQNLGLFFLASIYVSLFGYAGYTFWYPNQWNIPQIVGGIFTLVAVMVTPVGVYGLQKYFDYFPVNAPGLFGAVSVVIASGIALTFVPWPFLTAPLSFALFFISEADLAPLIYDEPIGSITPDQRDWVSVIFGLTFLSVNYLIDRIKSKQDFTFWGYIFGLLAFCGGLTDMYFEVYRDDWEYQLIYGAINVVLLGLAVVLQRNAFLVFGGFGITLDIVDYLITESTVEINSWFSIGFGSILIGAAYTIANKDPSQDFPFWGYLSGVFIFWAGWTTLFAWPVYDNYYFSFLYFVVNVGLMAATVQTKQRVFLVFGSIGVFWYVEYLVHRLFWDSWYLPLVLTVIGLVFIGLAVYYSGGFLKRRAAAAQEFDLEKSKNVCSVNEGNIAYPVVFHAVPVTPSSSGQVMVVPYPTFHQDL